MSVATAFNESYYLSNNADVVLAISQGHFSSALQHYQLFGGKNELRDPNSTFDASYYASKNPDVLTAVSNGTIANVFTHYQIFGEKENRAPSVTYEGFTASAYLAANADVQAAVTAGTIASALEHYIAFGASESRSGSGITTSASTGTTFTLTTTSDNLTGTAKDDTFNGVIDQATAANSTINAGDQIDGGAGNDTLSITGVGTTLDVLAAATVTNVETVNIRASTANSLNASQISGLTSVNADRGAGTVLVTNLATGASIGIIGNGTVAQGELAFAYATTTDAINLNISNGVKQGAGDSITAAGTIAAGNATGTATTATINSTGAANTLDVVDLANATLTTMTVNAATNLKGDFFSEATNQVGTDGKLTISGAAASVEFTAALDNTLVTIDASGLTAGGLTATLGTGAKTVTGGAGNDVITTAATTATGAAISGGAGTDTLILAATNDVSTSAKAGQYTNFETLRVNNSQDVSLFGSSITAVEVGAMTSKTVSGLSATQAANVTVRGDQTTAVTFALANATGTSDALNLKLGTGLTTSAATSLNTSLVVTGFESLTMTTNQGPTATTANSVSTIGAITGATLSTITLKGGGFSIANAATTLKTTIDGSALTGVLTLGGNLIAGSTVTGGAGADAFTAGTNNGVTYTGGAGNDTLNATVTQLVATGTNDTKFVGGDGTDTLAITDTAPTVTDNHFTNISGTEAITLSTGAISFTSGTAFNNAFASGVTITDGVTAATNAVAYNLGLSTVATTVNSSGGSQTGAATENVTITTGTGADTITFSATGYVGVAGAAQGTITISAGSGDDTISATRGASVANGTTTNKLMVITGGLGADTITTSGTNSAAVGAANGVTEFVIADGDSLVASRDVITGFNLGTAGALADTLNLEGTPTVEGDTAGVNGTDSGTIKSHAITNGIITFDDVDTFASAVIVNSSNLSDVTSYLATNISTATRTVAFAFDKNGDGANDGTMVFNQGTSDTLVELVGVVGTSISATNATTAGLIDLA